MCAPPRASISHLAAGVPDASTSSNFAARTTFGGDAWTELWDARAPPRLTRCACGEYSVEVTSSYHCPHQVTLGGVLVQSVDSQALMSSVSLFGLDRPYALKAEKISASLQLV